MMYADLVAAENAIEEKARVYTTSKGIPPIVEQMVNADGIQHINMRRRSL